MNTAYIKILEPCQYSIWDVFVDISPQGEVFCHTWWLDAITKSKFKILVCFDNEEIVAGMPLAYDGKNRVNEPPLTRTLGVLFKPQADVSDHKYISNKRRWLTALLEELPLNNFVQMCMHHNFTDWLPFRWRGFKQTTRYTFIIDYKGVTTDKLWKNISEGTQRVIKSARKYSLKVEETDDFAMLYHFECLTYKRQGLVFKAPFEDLDLLDKAICKYGKRTILKATDSSNRIHAMLYFVHNEKSSYLLLSGSDEKYRKFGGHTLVLWESIKYLSDKTAYFNFGGSDIERIESHFKRFGGVQTPYFHIYNENLLWEREDIWYHIDQTFFHFIQIWKAFIKKTLKIFTD